MGKNENYIFPDRVEKVHSKINRWHAKLLFLGGKAILTRYILLSLPIHFLAFVHFPKGVLYQIEKMVTSLFWGGSIEKKKCHWSTWEKLYFPYEEEGLILEDFMILALPLHLNNGGILELGILC